MAVTVKDAQNVHGMGMSQNRILSPGDATPFNAHLYTATIYTPRSPQKHPLTKKLTFHIFSPNQSQSKIKACIFEFLRKSLLCTKILTCLRISSVTVEYLRIFSPISNPRFFSTFFNYFDFFYYLQVNFDYR